MVTILPNWHPFWVHFTIALLLTAVLFYFARLLLSDNHVWKEQWLNMANWSLWTGCLFAVVTIIAGWFAYNSVAHDTASHAAMTLHRNLALPTAGLFIIIGLSAIYLERKNREPQSKFLASLIIAALMLLGTGYLGAEAVYRYGLGVMSLPEVTAGADGHNHSHSIQSEDVETNSEYQQHENTLIQDSENKHQEKTTESSESHHNGHDH